MTNEKLSQQHTFLAHTPTILRCAKKGCSSIWFATGLILACSSSSSTCFTLKLDTPMCLTSPSSTNSSIASLQKQVNSPLAVGVVKTTSTTAASFAGHGYAIRCSWPCKLRDRGVPLTSACLSVRMSVCDPLVMAHAHCTQPEHAGACDDQQLDAYHVSCMVTSVSGLPGSPLPGAHASGQCMSMRSKYLHPRSFRVFSQDSLQQIWGLMDIFLGKGSCRVTTLMWNKTDQHSQP